MKKIRCVSDLLGELKYINTDSEVFYRGHANKNWELKPSIFRDEFKGREFEFYINIRNRNFLEFKSKKNIFDELALMQHYSVPTRLLDWTSNPLVALYFATNSKIKEDGEIFIYTPKDVYYSDMVMTKLIALLAVHSKAKYIDIEHYMSLKIDHLEHRTVKDVTKEDEKLAIGVVNSILMVKPKITNERLNLQSGCFTINGNIIEGKLININEPVKFNIYDEQIKRILVDKEYKEKIREELNIIGINESILFPEFENYAFYLREKLKNKVVD